MVAGASLPRVVAVAGKKRPSFHLRRRGGSKLSEGMGWPLRLIGDALELRYLRRELPYFHRRLMPTTTNRDGSGPKRTRNIVGD